MLINLINIKLIKNEIDKSSDNLTMLKISFINGFKILDIQKTFENLHFNKI